MAKRVKTISVEDEQSKDNVTYKKKVVTSIVSLATQEINGITSLSRSAMSTIKGVFKRNSNRGILVEFNDNLADVDVFVNVKFGCSVKDVAFRVQENIKSSIESMTEFKVHSVNVHVVGVTFNDLENDFVS